MSQHVILPQRLYFRVFAALLLLTFVTVAVAYIDLGPLNNLVALSIAVTKTVLVILYFMHVRYSSQLTWVFVGAGFFWLLLMIALTLSDVFSRGWLPLPQGWEAALGWVPFA
ncbi:MAG: cytochrome C oxidase subunit IV family protein [Candidatus Binatia bacterium]|nr:cytochrome C oxidase subunit IV family protein [Candidatus Binatia bacterium]